MKKSQSKTKSRASSRAKAPRAKSSKNDPVAMLKADHKKVLGLIEDLEKSLEQGDDEGELFQEIAEEIRVHARLEEEIFYPAFLEAVEKKNDSNLYYKSVEAHQLVTNLLEDMEEEDPASEEFGGKVAMLKELIESHAAEEEKEMFPRAQKVLDKDELEGVGEEMASMKQQLTGAAEGEEEEDEGEETGRSGARRAASARLATEEAAED